MIKHGNCHLQIVTVVFVLSMQSAYNNQAAQVFAVSAHGEL